MLVLQHPLWSTAVVATTLIVILGIYGLFIGASMLVRAFRGDGWGVGIMVVGGIGMIVMSFRMDDSSPQEAQL